MPLASSQPHGPRLLAVGLELEPDPNFLRELESRLNAQDRAAHPIP